MTQSPNLIKAYTRATHTVAKTRQVVMLYDGAIRFLKQAAEAMEKGEIEQRYLKLTRVSEVVSGLQNCLDFTSGGNTAQVLYDFYAGIDTRVFNLHRTPSPEACRQLIADLKEMRDVWDTIDRGGDNAGTASAPGVPTDQPADAVATSAAVKFSA
jgi:flagellar protein FliS